MEAGPPQTYYIIGGYEMSAFGTGPFENDGALDFFDEIFESGNVVATCTSIFNAAINSSGLYDDECECVSVCGAIVDSVINGTDYEDIATDLAADGMYMEWINGLRSASLSDFIQLKDKAAKALAFLISEDSEMYEGWNDAGSLLEWREPYEQMIKRLQNYAV